MTEQQIFDKVATHLLRQNARSSVETSAMDNKVVVMCKYRDFASGRSCAIGCLITDDAYSPELETRTVRTPEVQAALEQSGVPCHGSLVNLLSSLQDFHDANEAKYWREGLANLASRFYLDPSILAEDEPNV